MKIITKVDQQSGNYDGFCKVIITHNTLMAEWCWHLDTNGQIDLCQKIKIKIKLPLQKS